MNFGGKDRPLGKFGNKRDFRFEAGGMIMMLPPLSLADTGHVLTHTRELWEDLRGARLFITGGTGFFGTWLLESLSAANREFSLDVKAVILTRNPTSFANKVPHLQTPAFSLHPGDVRDFDFPSGTFSHVIHAGTTSGSPVAPLEMFNTILGGTRRTLDFSVEKKIQSFLFVSSGAVYGRQPDTLVRIPESYRGGPDVSDTRSAYAEGKRAAELLCAVYQSQYGLATKIARCFAFVGPHLPLDSHFAIGNFIRDAMARRPIRITGDGTAVRSYLYAADLAVALWTTLVKGPRGCSLNIGSEEAYSMVELAEAAASVLNPGAEIQIAGVRQPGAIHRYVPDCSLARELIGVETRIKLPEALMRTADWLQRNVVQ